MPTVLVLFARLIAACITDNNDRYRWIDFDKNQRQLSISVMFLHNESRFVESSSSERAAHCDGG